MKGVFRLILTVVLGIINNAGFSQPPCNWAVNPNGLSDDWGYSIAVDGTGNSYVTGYFQGTVTFNASAPIQVTSNGGKDIFLAKYDPSGSNLWAIGIGSTGDDIGYGVAVGATGVYITGEFQGAADFDPGAGSTILTPVGGGSDIDIFFAKYNFSGSLVWAKNIGSTNNDHGYGIATDASGNCYITGSYGGGTADFDPGTGTANLTTNGVNFDIYFAKYDASGNYIWAKSIGGLGGDIGHAITVDAAGNVFITGEYAGTADFDPGSGTTNLTPVGNMDIFFAKYTSTGAFTWAKSIGSIGGDIGYAIAVDASGNVYIAGMFNGVADFNPGAGTLNLTSTGSCDAFFGKYTSAGALVWAKNIGGATTDEAHGIAVDASGNVYVNGFFWGTADFDPGAGTINMTAVGNYDGFFAKYSSAGSYVWAADIGSTSFDYVSGIALDASDNIYITGSFNNTADFEPGAGTVNRTSHGGYNIFAAKYGITSLPINLLYFTADGEQGDVIKTEWATASETNNDYFNVEKSNDGTDFESIFKINGAGNSTSEKTYSFIDKHPFHGINYYRLRQTDFDGKFTYSRIISVTSGHSNAQAITIYPNPTAGIITISGLIAGGNQPSYIEIYDIIGNRLYSSEIKNPKPTQASLSEGGSEIVIDVSAYSKGIYLIRITTDEGNLVRRIVKN